MQKVANINKKWVRVIEAKIKSFSKGAAAETRVGIVREQAIEKLAH